MVTIKRISWRQWRWSVDDLSDRHGSYHGVCASRARALAEARAVLELHTAFALAS